MTGNTDHPASPIAWFELPALDLERAAGFYETILQIRLRRESYAPGIEAAVFPYREPAVSGCVVHGGPYRPHEDGAVVYLTCDGRLDQVMARVEPAGGRLLGPKIALPPGMGAFVHIRDTEGNRLGLHGLD